MKIILWSSSNYLHKLTQRSVATKQILSYFEERKYLHMHVLWNNFYLLRISFTCWPSARSRVNPSLIDKLTANGFAGFLCDVIEQLLVNKVRLGGIFAWEGVTLNKIINRWKIKKGMHVCSAEHPCGNLFITGYTVKCF